MMVTPEDFSLGAALLIFWGLSVYFTWVIRGNLAFRQEMALARRQQKTQCEAPCDEVTLAGSCEVYYIDRETRSKYALGHP